MFFDDAFGDGEAEAGAAGVEAGGGEGLEESRGDGGVEAWAVVLDGEGDAVEVGVGVDLDGAAAVEGVDGVAEEVDEDLEEAVGVALDDEPVGDAVKDGDAGGFAVEADEGPGFVGEGCEGRGGGARRAGAGVVEEAFAEAFEAADDAGEEGGVGGREGEAWAALEALGEALGDGEGRVHLVGEAGGEQAQGGKAVGAGEGAFLFAEGVDGAVAGAHDFAQFVGGDEGFGDDLVLGGPVAGGAVGVEHGADGAVDVLGEDEGFEGQGDEAVGGEEGEGQDDDEAVHLGAGGFEACGGDEAETAGAVDGEDGGCAGVEPAEAEAVGVELRIAEQAEVIGGGVGTDGAAGDADAGGEVAVDEGEYGLGVEGEVAGGGAVEGLLDLGEGDGEGEAGLVDLGLGDDAADGGAEGQAQDGGEGEGEEGVEDDEFFADAHAGEEAGAAFGLAGLDDDALGVGHRGIMGLLRWETVPPKPRQPRRSGDSQGGGSGGKGRGGKRPGGTPVPPVKRGRTGGTAGPPGGEANAGGAPVPLPPLKAPRSYLKPLEEPIDAARDAVCELIAQQAAKFPHLELVGLDESKLPAKDAALAHAILDAVIRRWLTLRDLLSRRVSQPVEGIETGVQAALLVGAAQLILLDRVPAYAAIDHAVEWAKRRVRPGAGGFVNAVLRKVAAARAEGEGGKPVRREQWTFQRDELPLGDGSALVLREAELPEDKTERLAAATSHAPQLIWTWLEAHEPETVIRLALHSLATAPTILNLRHAGFLPLGPGDVTPHEREGFAVYGGPRETLASLLESRDDVWAQDPASAEAVESARGVKPGLIMDLCAGRGTKTRQLAQQFPQSRIIATDVDAGRHAELSEVFKGHPRVTVVPPKDLVLEYSGAADLILLDVPCSNTGVLARRPEAKYRFNRQNMQSLVDIQRQVIADSVALLSPRKGSAILYSTCSLDRRENQEIAQWAVKWHKFKPGRERTAMPAGGPGEPGTRYTDGSYSVLLVR